PSPMNVTRITFLGDTDRSRSSLRSLIIRITLPSRSEHSKHKEKTMSRFPKIIRLGGALLALSSLSMTALQPAQAQIGSGPYSWMGRRYNSWPQVRRRIIGSVAPDAAYRTGYAPRYRHHRHREMPSVFGSYRSLAEYQNNLNFALRFGKGRAWPAF